MEIFQEQLLLILIAQLFGLFLELVMAIQTILLLVKVMMQKIIHFIVINMKKDCYLFSNLFTFAFIGKTTKM